MAGTRPRVLAQGPQYQRNIAQLVAASSAHQLQVSARAIWLAELSSSTLTSLLLQTHLRLTVQAVPAFRALYQGLHHLFAQRDLVDAQNGGFNGYMSFHVVRARSLADVPGCACCFAMSCRFANVCDVQ